MGNSCISTVDYYQSLRGPKICIKCNDNFKPKCGGKSERTSCRYHIYNKNNYCTFCRSFKNELKFQNCYHSV